MFGIKREEVQENRKKWLEFLREPGRKKAQGALEYHYDPDARCCLGHAGHLFVPDTRKLDGDYVFYDGRGNTAGRRIQRALFITHAGEFRESVVVDRSRGIESDEEVTLNDDGNVLIGSCATLNDATDLTMAEIADIIEEQFKNNNLVEPDYGAFQL